MCSVVQRQGYGEGMFSCCLKYNGRLTSIKGFRWVSQYVSDQYVLFSWYGLLTLFTSLDLNGS